MDREVPNLPSTTSDIYGNKREKSAHGLFFCPDLRVKTPERWRDKRRFLKLWHLLTCLDGAEKSRTAIFLECEGEGLKTEEQRERERARAARQESNSPFSSAFYASKCLHLKTNTVKPERRTGLNQKYHQILEQYLDKL